MIINVFKPLAAGWFQAGSGRLAAYLFPGTGLLQLVSYSLHWQHFYGVIIAFIATLLWNEMTAHETVGGLNFLCTSFPFIQYFFCLVWEIIKANIVVAGIMLNPKLPTTGSYRYEF